MLKVENVGKTVHGKAILKSMSFEVSRGTIAVFLGGSGAGKTTLLRVLNNLESYDTGTFRLDGNELELKRVSKEHLIGMVFQHFNLFEHLSVEKNITLPLVLQGASEESAHTTASLLLQKYGLSEKAEGNVARLSGGQKQRLAIARTVALNPQVICLDEPTSALDPVLTGQVARFVQDLADENRIVLLTSHDMGLIESLDCQLFFMNNGTIMEATTSHEYRQRPSNYPWLYSFLKR